MEFKNAIALALSIWTATGTLSPPLAAQSAAASTAVASESPEQLQQLVAPIALYPDELLAQILAAATYPTQVVEADRWLQEHTSLKGQDLAKAVDEQAWDPSVKALTQFPSVLANMDKNLSWTSSLGQSYVDQPLPVMDAVQVMRRKAQLAGNLKSTQQETVKTKGETIVVEPAQPDVVYVPEYDPWLVYGGALPIWPGWYPYPGLYLAGPGFGFGVGFEVGLFGGIGWGWHHWGFDWGHRNIVFNHNTYISHSNTFVNRNTFINRNTVVNRNAVINRNTFTNRNMPANNNAFRNQDAFDRQNGFGRPGGSAFGGFTHGGITMNHSFRGRSSFGGFHGGRR